jgi:hypothetical protein
VVGNTVIRGVDSVKGLIDAEGIGLSEIDDGELDEDFPN